MLSSGLIKYHWSQQLSEYKQEHNLEVCMWSYST